MREGVSVSSQLDVKKITGHKLGYILFRTLFFTVCSINSALSSSVSGTLFPFFYAATGMRGFGATLCLNPEKDLTGTRQSGQRTGCELERFVFTINRKQFFPNRWLQPHATISSPVWFSRQIPHGSSVGRFSSEIFKTRGRFSVRLIQRSIASSLLSLALWTR
jgi:hypothetical protein